MAKARVESGTDWIDKGVGFICTLARAFEPFVRAKVRNFDYSQKRLELQRELFSQLAKPAQTTQPAPEHHSLVGYFVTLNSSKEAKDFMEKAKNKIKKFMDVGEVEEIDYDEFRRRFPKEELYQVPMLVIWSTELNEPFLKVPLSRKTRGGKLGEVEILEDQAEGEAVEGIEEEKELAKVS